MSSGIGQAADLERDRVQRRVRVMKHPQASQALALGALLVSGSVVGAQPASAGEAVPPNVAVAAQGSALEEVRALGRAFGAQDPQAGPLARASEVAHLRRVYVWNARPGTSVLVPGATNRYIGQIISAGRVVGSVELVQPVSAVTRNCPETATKLPAGGHENCPLTVMGFARHEVVCLAALRG